MTVAASALFQSTDVRAAVAYDDTLASGATLETAAASLRDDMDALRSQVARMIHGTVGGGSPWTSDITGLGLIALDTAVAAASGATTREEAYTNQGVTSVVQTVDATVDIDNGINWKLRDPDGNSLFLVKPDTAGSASEVRIPISTDFFYSDSVANEFRNGIKVSTLANGIDIATGTLGVGGSTPIRSPSTGMLVEAVGGQLYMGDVNQPASTYPTPMSWSDSTGEWNAVVTRYGAVSLLSMLDQAGALAASATTRGTRVEASLTSTATAGTDVGGVAGGANLSAQLPSFTAGTFTQNYDVYTNGGLRVPSNVGGVAQTDYYPGTSLNDGQLKFNHTLHKNTTITVIPWS